MTDPYLEVTLTKRLRNEKELLAFETLVALKFPALLEESDHKKSRAKGEKGRMLGEIELGFISGDFAEEDHVIIILDGYSASDISRELDCNVTVAYDGDDPEAALVTARKGRITKYEVMTWVERDVSKFNSRPSS